jgi:hypothetical protein
VAPAAFSVPLEAGNWGEFENGGSSLWGASLFCSRTFTVAVLLFWSRLAIEVDQQACQTLPKAHWKKMELN